MNLEVLKSTIMMNFILFYETTCEEQYDVAT